MVKYVNHQVDVVRRVEHCR